MKMIAKHNKYQEYVDWVETLDSVISQEHADIACHFVGHGEKKTDLYIFPLTQGEYDEFKHMGHEAWEEKYGDQWRYVATTQHLAIREGVPLFWV